MTDAYTALDLETTGLNPKKDKIIEIGAVKVRNGEITDRFQSFVNPGRVLENKVKNLTGICDAMLEGAPEMGELIEPLIEFLGEDVLVGHRILFDYSFVKKTAIDSSLSFERMGIDTLKLSRSFAGTGKQEAGILCGYYQIAHTAHRALGDAQAASDLYRKLAELFYEGNETEFAPKPLLFRVKKDTPVSKKQKERLYKLLDRHRIAIGYNVDKLTRSEADRIIDQILAKYGR